MLIIEKKRNTLFIRLAGELDDNEASRIRAEVDARIADSGARRLVFDLSELHFMDSSGIGLIIGRYKRMRQRGGTVAVHGGNAQIDKILKMAGLYELVEKMA